MSVLWSRRAIGKACRAARTIADRAAERRSGLPRVAGALQCGRSGFGAPGDSTQEMESFQKAQEALKPEKQ